MANGRFLSSLLLVCAAVGLCRAQGVTRSELPPPYPGVGGGPSYIQPPGGPGVEGGPLACPPGPLPEEPEEVERPLDDEEIPPLFVWASAEYLFWTVKNGPVPEPLVTTTTNVDDPNTAGGLGQPGTIILFGQGSFDYGNFSGGRFTLGWWLDPDRVLGPEVTLFLLEKRRAAFGFGSDVNGIPLVGRPVKNAVTGVEGRSAVAFPGFLAGQVNIDSPSRLWGVELNAVDDVGRIYGINFNLLLGFRYVQLDEALNMLEHKDVLAAGATSFNGIPVVPPATITQLDRFRTLSHFFGGQVGVRGDWNWWRLFVNAQLKLAAGMSHNVVDISGVSTIFQPGNEPLSLPGAVYALPSNIGKHTRDDFALVPEMTLSCGYYVTPYVRLSAGYTAMYWSSVVRPGEQIDRTVNSSQAPTGNNFGGGLQGPARPAILLNRSDFSAGGLSLGLSFRY